MNTLDQLVSSLKRNPTLAPVLLTVLEQLDHARAKIEDASRPEPFSAFEPCLIQAIRGFSSQVHARLLSAYDTPAAQVVEVQGELYTRMKPTPSTYHCLDGSFVLERSYYRAKAGGPGICPLELRAGLVENKYTPLAAEYVLLTCASDDYRKSERAHKKAGLLHVSKSALERDVISMGARIEQLTSPILAARVACLQVVEGARSVSIQLDRTGIPFEEAVPRGVGRPKKGAPKNPCEVVKRQCYCGCLTLHDEKGRALMTQRFGGLPHEGARIVEEMKEVLAWLMAHHPGLDVVLVCDGAKEMMSKARDVAEKHEIKQEVVDFYHSAQYVHQAVDAAGKPPDWGEKFVKKLLENKTGARELLLRMRTWRMDGASEKLSESIRFFENHSEQMDYARARARGYVVGSGNVEATCKSVVAVRFKRSGARWKKKGARPLLGARTWQASDQNVWDAVLPVFTGSYVIPLAA